MQFTDKSSRVRARIHFLLLLCYYFLPSPPIFRNKQIAIFRITSSVLRKGKKETWDGCISNIYVKKSSNIFRKYKNKTTWSRYKIASKWY